MILPGVVSTSFTNGTPIITKSFFGADCNNGFGTPFNQPVLLDGNNNPAVINTIRFWDNGCKWTQLQSGPSTYDWSELNLWITACQDSGYNIIYTFGATPTFIASSCSGASGCSNVSGYTNNCCPPTDVNSDGSGTDATFIGFVTALINQVGPGTIKYYELWNEQDSANFWSGNTAQAVRMGQDAAAVIRSLDPTATILSPSFHGPTASTFFVDYCETEVNGIYGWQNFDVVNVHMRASDINEAGNKNANVDPTCFFTAYNQTLSALATLQADGINLSTYPIWDDEHGYIDGQGGDGYPPVITDNYVYAAYVAVSTILRASVGLQFQSYYCWTTNDAFLALQSDPAGTAWDTVANLIIGKTVGICSPNTNYSQGSNVYGSPIYTVPVDNGNGLFVWDQSQSCSVVSDSEVCTYSTYNYSSQYSHWADIFGNTGTLSGGTVNIGCCPLYLY
jgi:hypothetical protein